MPLPVILWGAAAALGLWAVHEFFSEDEKEKIEDKRIVILGDRAVGKTHLYDFLEKGKVPTSYEQTPIYGIEKLGLKIGKFNISGTDVRGSENRGSHHSRWQDAMKEVDFLFYLVDAHKTLIEKDVTKIKNECLLIIRFLKENDNKKPDHIFIIGSHMDKIPNKNQKHENDFHTIKTIEEFRKELNRLNIKNTTILGNLRTDESAAKLVQEIIRSI